MVKNYKFLNNIFRPLKRTKIFRKYAIKTYPITILFIGV